MTETIQPKRTRSQKNRHRKKQLSLLIGIAATAIALLVGSFLLFANDPNRKQPDTDNVDFTTEIKKYFKQHGAVATFKRKDVEILEKTNWLNDQFVQLTIESSKGNRQEVYRLSNKTIDLVYNELYFETPKTFTTDELTALETIDTVLQWPLETKRFGSKNMIYPVEFETPFLDFANTVQIEKVSESGKTIDYYAEGYGFVGQEFVLDDQLFLSTQLETLNLNGNN